MKTSSEGSGPSHAFAGRQIATRPGVKKIVLTQYYPECDAVDVADQCKKTYNRQLVLAVDIMEIELSGRSYGTANK